MHRPRGEVLSTLSLFHGIQTLALCSSFAVLMALCTSGCGHTAQTWFELPESRAITVTALQKSMAVVAPTSQDRDTGCWNPFSVEISLVEKALLQLHSRYNWSVPRYALGTSSGGVFVGGLASGQPTGAKSIFDAVCLMISALNKGTF